MQKLALAVGLGTAIWLSLIALAWMYQERVVFQPPRGERPTAPDTRRVRYSAPDGAPLAGYLVGDLRSAPVVMLAFHGNADLARWLVPWAEEVHRSTGAAVFLAEYRGYDGLEGTPTYSSASVDAHAALDFVRDSEGVGAERLVYFGHSLGSAVATELAVANPPRALVLQSPFTSARAMAGRLPVPGIGWLWPLVSRVHFDTERRVRDLHTSVWVAHGDRDMLIPAYMGRAVFEAAARKGRLLVVRGAGHNDVAERGATEYWSWLRGALGLDRPVVAGTGA